MILGDSELDECRQVAELAMTDRLWISGPSRKQTNPETGQLETVPGPAKYGTATDPISGAVQAIGQGTQTEQIVGGQVVTIGTYAVKVPVSVDDVVPADEVHVVESDDPTLLGRSLVVAEPAAGNTYAIQRRLVATLDLG